MTAATAARADGACQPPDGLSSCLPVDNLWPQPGAGRWFAQAPTGTPPGGAVSFGLVLSFVHRPLGLQIASPDPAGTTVYAIDSSLGAVVLASLGLTDRLAVQLAAPMIVLQDGAGKSDVVGSDDPLPQSAAGDLRFGAAVSLLERPPGADGAALAGRFEMSAPTGDQRAFVSAGTASYAPGLSFDYRLGRLTLGADAGARIRREVRFADLTLGSQIAAGLGAGVAVLPERWLGVNLESFALFTLAAQRERAPSAGRFGGEEQPAPPHIPAEWLLSLRTAHLLDGALSFSAGAGSMIPTGEHAPATAPALRVMAGVRYAPSAKQEIKMRAEAR